VTVQWLRGAAAQPRYIGLGWKPNRLYPVLSYLTGWRETTERLVMRLPTPVLRRESPWPGADEPVAEVLATQAAPHSALFLYTGYYKSTAFVGPVVKEADSSDLVFWKAFPDEVAAGLEVDRAATIGTILPGRASIAQSRTLGGGVVEYERLARSRRPLTDDDLIELAREVGRLAQEAPVASSVVRDSAVTLDQSVLESVCLGLGRPRSELSALRSELAKCASAPLYLSHGDFTRWNVFAAQDGGIAVVDYDAVGLRPAFFDMVHLIGQDATERGSEPSVELLRKRVPEATSSDLRVCLFWDAYETMLQYVDNPHNRDATGETVMLKLSAWRKLRDE
jgi:hypothetical protein